MALHLDRAMEIGYEVAQNFINNLKKYKQIPDDINTPRECISYLQENTDFVFRNISYQSEYPDVSIEDELILFEHLYSAEFGDYAEIEDKYNDVIEYFDKNISRK